MNESNKKDRHNRKGCYVIPSDSRMWSVIWESNVSNCISCLVFGGAIYCEYHHRIDFDCLWKELNKEKGKAECVWEE